MKKRFSDIIEVQVNDECTKYTVKYATGNTRTYNSKPSWFDWYADNSWSLIQDGFTVWAYSSTYIKATYKPVEMPWHTTNENPVEVEETSTPVEVAERATAEIFHIIDNMPENSGLEYGMKAIHIMPTNNNTFAVIADTERFGKNQIMFESYDIMQCVEYVKNSIHTTPADPEVQEITSADTSINSESIPVVFSTLIEKADKLNISLNNTTIFDTGCGKYPEIISEKLNDYHVGYYGRDKYNQPEHINNMFPIFAANCTDNRVFTSSNVMNVIKGENFRIDYLKDIMQYMRKGEKLYITVYDGDRSGVGRITKIDKSGSATCWQENRKYKDYIPECIKAGFTSVTPKYNMLICTL